MYSIPGNHDLKYHNIQNYADSTFSILANTGKLKYAPRFDYKDDTVVTCVPFGTSLKDIPERVNDKFNILMLHYFVYQEALPFDTHTCTTNELLTKLDYDLIITGDNHQTLIATVDDRTLINPGSISRQKADEATNKPCVFLYNIKTRTYKQVFLDCETEVITREHIEKETEREYRFEAFINKAKVTNETTMDVDDDLQKYFQENNTDQEVIEILMKAGAK
jgi:DNA repair exonuclease SbcCD nuclease subunit